MSLNLSSLHRGVDRIFRYGEGTHFSLFEKHREILCKMIEARTGKSYRGWDRANRLTKQIPFRSQDSVEWYLAVPPSSSSNGKDSNRSSSSPQRVRWRICLQSCTTSAFVSLLNRVVPTALRFLQSQALTDCLLLIIYCFVLPMHLREREWRI